MDRKTQDSRKPDSGAILIISLWILSALTLFAVGLGHRLSFEIRLVEAAMNSQKAYYAAMAGIHKTIAEKQQPDSLDTGAYAHENTAGDKPWHYTVQDEESKVDINKASFGVLKYLLIAGGLEDTEAETTAAAIIDWCDEDSNPYNNIGAEDDFYESEIRPYQCKDAPFDYTEELILVRGITPEVFYGKDINENGIIEADEQGIIKDVTVFGANSVNINTAGSNALRAFLKDAKQAELLVENIVSFRRGRDKIAGNSDDRIFIRQASADGIKKEYLNLATGVAGWSLSTRDTYGFSKEQWSLLVYSKFSTATSTYRITSRAQVKDINRTIEAVVHLSDDGQCVIMAWGML